MFKQFRIALIGGPVTDFLSMQFLGAYMVRHAALCRLIEFYRCHIDGDSVIENEQKVVCHKVLKLDFESEGITL